jgi:rRNA maturation RNase YbeY
VITFLSEDIAKPSINDLLITRWITSVIHSNKYVVGELTVLFCSDEYILSVNNQFLQHDYFTDIITFNYCKDNVISGDLLISVDTVRTNSEQYECDFLEELHRVIIHGVLHLIGFDDKNAASQAIMRKEEDKSLALLRTL